MLIYITVRVRVSYTMLIYITAWVRLSYTLLIYITVQCLGKGINYITVWMKVSTL